MIAVIGPQTAKTGAEFGLRGGRSRRPSPPRPAWFGRAGPQYAAGVPAIAAWEPVCQPSGAGRGRRAHNAGPAKPGQEILVLPEASQGAREGERKKWWPSSPPPGRAGCAGPPRCGRLVAQTSVRPRPRRRCSSRRASASRSRWPPCQAWSSTPWTYCARPRPGGRGGCGWSCRGACLLKKDARGSAATTRGGILPSPSATWPPRWATPTAPMADLCLDEYTDHGHCGILTGSGEVDNDATPGAVRIHRGRSGGGGRSRGRAERDDGRPGGRSAQPSTANTPVRIRPSSPWPGRSVTPPSVPAVR